MEPAMEPAQTAQAVQAGARRSRARIAAITDSSTRYEMKTVRRFHRVLAAWRAERVRVNPPNID